MLLLLSFSHLFNFLFSSSEGGVQAPPALPKDQRVPVAGRTHGVCHQRGGRGRGKKVNLFSTVLETRSYFSVLNVEFGLVMSGECIQTMLEGRLGKSHLLHLYL